MSNPNNQPRHLINSPNTAPQQTPIHLQTAAKTNANKAKPIDILHNRINNKTIRQFNNPNK